MDSLAVALVGEETNGKSEGNYQWHGKENTYEHIPPVDLVIEQLVENFNELGGGNEDYEQGDSLDTAVNWEDHAALQIFGLHRLALAHAAAAHSRGLLDSKGSLSLLNRSQSILLRLS